MSAADNPPPRPLEPSLVPFDWREALAVARRYRWLVAGATGIGLVLAVVALMTERPVYRARAVIRAIDTRMALTGGLVDGPVLGFQGRSADPLLSLVEVLASRAIAGTVVDSMPDLRVYTSGFPASVIGDVRFTSATLPDSLRLVFRVAGVTVQGDGGAAEAAYGAPVEVDHVGFTVTRRPDAEHGTLRVVSRDAAISLLLGGLRVTPRQNTDVIDVFFLSSDPYRAQQVVNGVVKVFRTANAEAAQQQSRLRRQFIESQLALNDSILADARVALAAFRRRTRSSAPGAGSGDIEPLRTRRVELGVDHRTYAGWLAALRDSTAGPARAALRAPLASPTIAGHPIVAQLLGQLVRYESARDSLTGGAWGSAAAHPDVQRLNALIAPTEARLTAAVAGVLEGELGALDVRIAALDALITRRAVAMRESADTVAEEARLVEQVETTRELAAQLRGEYQKARIAEAAEVGQVEIVDLAALPRTPVGVGWPRRVAFALLLGLLVGVGGAFAADRLNNSVRGPEQIAALGLPVLGVIPHLDGGRKRATVSATGPLVEALRGIRLNLAQAHGSAGPVLVTVTSPGSRDGKSFVAANLALAFAHAGQQTLLLDADVRRGALHRALRAARRPGLTDFLAGKLPGDAIVQSTAHERLCFVAAGTRTSEAPELLGSPAMAQLVAGYRSSFDVLLVDSAPLGAGIDAVALGIVTGNVLMVLRLGMTNRELAAAKLDVLRRFPVRLLGVVLNDLREQSVYRYYAYYLEGYEANDEPVPARPVLRTRV